MRRLHRQGEVPIWCINMLGLCVTENGTKIEVLQAGTGGHKEHGKMLKRIQVLEDGRVPAKEAKNWEVEGQEG